MANKMGREIIYIVKKRQFIREVGRKARKMDLES